MQSFARQMVSRHSRLGSGTVLALVVCIGIEVQGTGEELQPRPDFSHAVAPFLEQYCYDCHGADTATDEVISFAPFTKSPHFHQQREFWQKVAQRLHTSEMPPADAVQPSKEERASAVKWLRDELETFSCTGPRDPGPPVLRRLNRTQYRNTVRDWLGIDFDEAGNFPPDDLAHGFDNNGDALALTTLQLEKFLAAAELISSQAILPPEAITEPAIRVRGRQLRGGEEFDRHGRRLITDGVIVASFKTPEDGRYVLRARVSAEQAGPELARMAFADQEGRLIKQLDVVARYDDDDTQLAVVTVPLKEGRNRVGIAFLNDFYEPEKPEPAGGDRNFYLHRLEVIGPVDKLERPASHATLLDGAPTDEQWWDDTEWMLAVDKILGRWLQRACRRPAEEREVVRLRELVAAARRAGSSFERAMQVALQAMLVSPQFLFIAPPDMQTPDDADHWDTAPIDEFALASRLSYFLWSTMPDERLLQLAESGELRKRFDGEVRRMLADDRAVELARNFGGSWLQTRQLATVQPDIEQFDFDDELRQAMEREVELLFMEIIRDDHSVFDFLASDFTYLNERLARHYGMDEVSGAKFRRVTLNDPRRGGVLTMAAVLTVTSNPDRTSPVNRGKWVLGQILGDEPPPPPPNVPDLARQDRPSENETLREKLARHRADSSCAVCHQRMDPMGLALENYDAVGRWRETDGELPVDASGELPDGRKFTGARGLRELLLSEKPMFRRSLAQQMLTYALGRGLRPADACTVSDIVNHLEEGDDKFSALVLGIVHSAPFQRQRVVKQAND